MDIIPKFTAWLTTYWPAILALVGVSTFINRMIQRLPDKYARVKNISAAINADIISFVAEVAGAFGFGPRKVDKPKDPPGPPSVGGVRTTIVTRLIFGATLLALPFVALALAGGCTRAQEAKVLPTLDFAQSLASSAANVLDFVEPFLPPGDAQLAAARAAQTAGDLAKVFDVARPLLERVAAGGDDVPQQIVADVVIGAQAAQSVEQGMRAVSGRNPDGSPKDVGQ